MLATISRDREAIRAGVFHLIFNITTVLLEVALVEQLIGLVEFIAPNASVERKIANAHVLFNVVGVLLFIGFLQVFAQLLHFLIPKKSIAYETA